MYPVTKAVAEQFKTNARQNLSLLVNPVVGESFELTSADILSAGLNINRYSATGDSVALGVCSAADLSLRVENGDGRFNDVVFEGAQIYASVGVEDGNNTQWVPLGYFTVDNAPRRLAVISITALDGMVQFDKLANRSALSLPNSVKNIVLACCNECNITIDTDLDALPNSSFVAQSVGDSEDLTYRTILQWCCQVMGVNGYMDWDGHLELSWYKKDGIPETVSGSIATFESVTEVPVSQLIVNVEPYQNLNGYDHPWVGGAGKNLLPITISSRTTNGITLTVNANGSVTVNGTATALTNFILTSSLALPDGTYVINGCPSGGGANSYRLDVNDGSIGQDTGGSATFNVSGGTGIRNVRLRIASGYTVNNLVFWPMIRIAGLSNTFEPYENICPIHPANGKNLMPMFPSTVLGDLTYATDEDGRVHVTGTTTQTRFYAIPFTLNKGDYILSGAPVGGQLTIRNGQAGAAPPSEFSGVFDDYGAGAKFSVSDTATAWLNIRSAAGTYDIVYKPMIRPVEIENDEYVPYKGFGITRTGKNLLDVEGRTATNAITYSPITIRGEACTIIKNGDVLSCATTGAWSKARFGVSPQFFAQGETYTISAHFENPNANTIGIILLDKAGVWHSQPSSYSKATSVDIKLTTTIDTEYTQIGFVVNNTPSNPNSTVVISNIQVELGSAVTSYEPYTAERYYPISDNPVYGGTLDVTTGVLTVTHIMVGAEAFTGYGGSGISAGGLHWFNLPKSYPAAKGGMNDRCSFAPYIADRAWASTKICLSTNTGGFPARIYDSATSIQDFATKYAGQTVVYEVAAPQTYQLTPTQVELLKGTNNIWADGDSTLSVTFPAVTEITPADRYNSDIYENAVTITGVSVKGKENQSVVGSEDYALAIDGNPLFTDDDVETIANGLSGLIGFSYHPFSASVLPMPYLYPLDMVAVQYKDEWYDCAVTEINFASTAPTQLKGTGESAQSRSYARINPLTNRERAIIENLKDEINTTLNKAVNNIIDFNNIISNALGLYHTNVADGSGGFIRYLHDAPDLESSTYIVTETAQGFAWTTNGWNGGTPVWQYGVTSGGYALFKWLSAEGIDVTRASSDYRAEVTPEHFNIYYKSDLIITIDATDRAIQTPRMVIPYSSTSNNSLRVGQLVWLPTPNGANAVVLGS